MNSITITMKKDALLKPLFFLFMILLGLPAWAQNVDVTGVVTSATDGEPLIGVSVKVDGSNRGTVTDLDGNYALKGVSPKASITFSYVGCVDQRIEVKGRTKINVQMDNNKELLDEVVVIGYGVQKRSNVTGAISTIKSSDLLNTPISDASSALQGKVSGVEVVNSTGAPGSTPTIRIRGYSSNGSSNPLYIVDGLKVSDISYLDPSSIKSMEVLKDAASAAIYGAEAGNGVILITTKGGEKGKTKITFDASFTFSSLAKKVDVMNAEQYKQFYTEGMGDTFSQMYENYNIAGTDTDWQDECYETGKMQKYNVGVQGGNDEGNFFITAGYMNNDGMMKMDKDYYRRVNSQINASYNIRKWLEVGTNNTITSSKSSSISESAQYGNMRNLLLADPLTPLYYGTLPSYIQDQIDNGQHPVQAADGRYYGYSWVTGGASNPLAMVDNNTTTYRTNFINGMTYANIKPIKNLVFTSRLGYTIGSLQQTDSHPIYMDSYNSSADTKANLEDVTYTTRYYQWENFANYLWDSKVAGEFSIMAGMSYSDYLRTSTGGKTNELSNSAGNFNYLSYSTNGADDYVVGDNVRRRQIAYYGRLSWNYLGRYNFQFNFRADAYDSAYLAKHHNWGYFPSVSAGWNFSEEEFMKPVVGDVFTSGKLRASWGINGSISNLGNYMYNSTLNIGMLPNSDNTANMSYYLEDGVLQGIYPASTLANKKLRWERSKQIDLGLDLRFFNGRLSANVDYYYKLTDGLLVQSVAPLMTGTATVYQNLGKVTNSGLELELEWRDNIGDFSYGIRGNISTVNNKVKEYRGEGSRLSGTSLLHASSATTYFEEGYPVWYILGYKMTGVDSATGAPIYQDTDGNETITENDRVNLGSAIPDFTYGLSLTAAYKGVDLNIYGAGASGNKLVYGLMGVPGATSWVNRPMFLYDGRWTSAGTVATMPSAQYQINDSRFYNSSAMVFSASYFKIKQIQLGYTLPKKWLQRLTIESLRVYASLDNFFTFTDYPGSDPEVNGAASTASGMAIDFGGYPMSKSVSFGLNIAF